MESGVRNFCEIRKQQYDILGYMGVSKTGGIPRNCRFTESGNDEFKFEGTHGTFRTNPHTVVG